MSVPTGNEDDFQGTGTTRVQPSLVLSKVFHERVEPLVNFGADINANDVDRSALRWAVGVTAQLLDPRITSYNVCYTKLLRRKINTGVSFR